jgi:ABC-type branched-subunit amino acid transport system ATPase component
MSDYILEVDGLKKSFGGIIAVDGVSFEIERGTVTGLIGPNGAGKTTTFNIVSGYHRPDSGSIRYDGTDIQDLMEPTTQEQAIKGGGAGIAGGLAGVTTGLITALPPLGVAGASVAGIGVGAAAYWGKNQYVEDLESHPHSRPFQLSKAGLARTFQITRELQGLTVLENMMLAAPDQRGENVLNSVARSSAVARDEKTVQERANDLLDLLEIDHLSDEYAGNLSGGQRKLLEMGRILMLEPELLLLDEPVAGVNPTLTEKLLDRIRALQSEGYTFLIVEHDMSVIMDLSDIIVVMAEGDKLMEGDPAEVQNDERVIDAYLGG